MIVFYLYLKINLNAKIYFQSYYLRKTKANKFAALSLKTELHQINLLILLCSLEINYY